MAPGPILYLGAAAGAKSAGQVNSLMPASDALFMRLRLLGIRDFRTYDKKS